MKVRCQNCGNLYDINETKVTKAKVKFKCRQCQEYVYVYKENIKSKNDLKESKKACSKCGYLFEPNDKACPHCNLQLKKNKSDIEQKQSEDIDNTHDSHLKKVDKNDKKPAEEKKKLDEILMFCRSCWQRIPTASDNCPHCGESYTP